MPRRSRLLLLPFPSDPLPGPGHVRTPHRVDAGGILNPSIWQKNPHTGSERFFIETPDGVVTRLDALHVSHIYDGLIEGRPDLELNRRLRRRFLAHLPRMWGERAVLDLGPTDAPGVMPEIAVAAWFTCFEPVGSHGDGEMGSDLVVVWHQDSMRGLPELPPGILARVFWRQHARNHDL